MPNTTRSSPDPWLTPEERQAALEEIRRKIAVGLEQAERGEVIDGEAAIREILEELEDPARAVQTPARSR
jgi:predicted transcriptional regulator